MLVSSENVDLMGQYLILERKTVFIGFWAKTTHFWEKNLLYPISQFLSSNSVHEIFSTWFYVECWKKTKQMSFLGRKL